MLCLVAAAAVWNAQLADAVRRQDSAFAFAVERELLQRRAGRLSPEDQARIQAMRREHADGARWLEQARREAGASDERFDAYMARLDPATRQAILAEVARQKPAWDREAAAIVARLQAARSRAIREQAARDREAAEEAARKADETIARSRAAREAYLQREAAKKRAADKPKP